MSISIPESKSVHRVKQSFLSTQVSLDPSLTEGGCARKCSKNRSNVNTAVLAALSATDSLDDGDPIVHVEVTLDDNGPRITGDLDAIVKQAGDHQNAAVIFDIACVDPIADDEFDRTADATASAVSALLEEVFDEAGHYPFVGQNIYIFTEPTVD